MRSIIAASHILAAILLALTALAPVHASAQPSIPIEGRYSVLPIKIYIPTFPKWAHDIVLNATLAWNTAQLWNLQNNPTATRYNFVETDDGTATSLVSFSMPSAYASMAVGWTTYKFAPGSRTAIVATQTYLTPTVFNDAQGSNATATQYAFWLALHELGRVLGLGSVLDGQDIMEPWYTPDTLTPIPKLSTLDLYAVQVLAQGSAPNFVTLPDGVQDQFTPVTSFLPTTSLHTTQDTPKQEVQSDSVQMVTRHLLLSFRRVYGTAGLISNQPDSSLVVYVR